jgi:glycine betaine/choline ABC-type transport system substrate-binding protein
VVARTPALVANPAADAALRSLSGRITVADMRRMNHAVDAGRRDAADVAREFLEGLR